MGNLSRICVTLVADDRSARLAPGPVRIRHVRLISSLLYRSESRHYTSTIVGGISHLRVHLVAAFNVLFLR